MKKIELTLWEFELLADVIYFEKQGDNMSPEDYSYYYLRNEAAQSYWGRYLTDLIEAERRDEITSR